MGQVPLALFIGSATIAQIIVLATFMGAIVLGSHILGGWADRVASSLKFYSIIEVGIGL